MDLGSESESIAFCTDLDSGDQINGTCCKHEDDDNNGINSDSKLPLSDAKNSDLLNCSNTEHVNSNSNTNTNTIAEEGPSSSPATREKASPSSTKGFGLKKWRRIRRNDHVPAVAVIKGKDIESETEEEKEKEKEKDYDSDSKGRMLKRAANLMNEKEKGKEKQKEKEKVGSSDSMIPTTVTMTDNATLTSNAFVAVDKDINGIATTFSAGVDTEDSHSHSHSHRSSSKSSTAASAPKFPLRASAQSHHPHLHPRDKHKIKNSNRGIQLGASPSPSLCDPSKKPRGGRGFDMDRERENSPLSSLDSDSRSSNSVSIRASSCGQTPALNPLNFDAEHPSPSLPGPPHSSTATNHHQLLDRHPLVDSILMLQSAQLALQTEVQKFEEIGKGISSLCDDSDKISGAPAPSMSFEPVGFMDNTADDLSMFNHAYFSKIIQTLERQLNVAEDRLKEKEIRIAELETSRSLESPPDHASKPVEQQYKRCIEMEAELQDLFKQKVEAELQSVALTRFTKDSGVLVEEWLNLMREQKSESSEQAQSPGMVLDVKNKAVMQQRQAEKLDRHNAGIMESEEILKMKRGVMKFTKHLFIQLSLLVLVIVLFVLQLGPKSAVVVPT